MKLIYKRIFILFSVALNIGFLVMGGFHACHQKIPANERRWKELMGIVRELNLPHARSAKAIENMARFRNSMDAVEIELEKARMDFLSLLGQAGPLDKEQLHRLVQSAEMFSQKKRSMFETHVIELRQILGNDSGARFFLRLKEYIASKHAVHG